MGIVIKRIIKRSSIYRARPSLPGSRIRLTVIFAVGHLGDGIRSKFVMGKGGGIKTSGSTSSMKSLQQNWMDAAGITGPSVLSKAGQKLERSRKGSQKRGDEEVTFKNVADAAVLRLKSGRKSLSGDMKSTKSPTGRYGVDDLTDDEGGPSSRGDKSSSEVTVLEKRVAEVPDPNPKKTNSKNPSPLKLPASLSIIDTNSLLHPCALGGATPILLAMSLC